VLVLLDFVSLSRPKHWIKNVFILMPVPFAVASGAAVAPLVFGLGVLAFCLANSSVYALNDAMDAARDRLHETKRRRPVAAGRISRTGAFLFSGALAASALGLFVVLGQLGGLWIALTYMVVNVVYSLGAKDVPLVDVFLLSSGFLLRVLLGCALLGVAASNWLLLCSYALALFLSLGKRRGDVVRGLDGQHRPSLSGYNLAYLDNAIGVMAATTLMAYALYLLDAAPMAPGREFLSLPFVVFGVLEYLRIVQTRAEGGNPVDLLLSSPTIIVCGFGWLAATLWSLRWDL
jgi:4-hydroxybenzoate polyprenyltransferase